MSLFEEKYADHHAKDDNSGADQVREEVGEFVEQRTVFEVTRIIAYGIRKGTSEARANN